MPKTATFDPQLFSEFAQQDQALLAQALEIIAQIPDDPDYHRPKGFEVAAILMGLNVDLKTLLAAILSDPRLQQLQPVPDIKAQFGNTVATLVKDVNWLNKIAVYSLKMTDQPSQTETLRRMLLSMTHDVRAVLIKLAYRVKRLHVLTKEAHDVRHFIAQETLDIYAPIANRMGIHQLKWELEDMAFRYINPPMYRHIAHSLNDKRVEREACIENFTQLLQSNLTEHGISGKVYGRPKHIYSIWKKMQRKRVDIDGLYDLLAVRVMVDNLTNCYAALGIVHSLWQSIPREFDDYIANPKENGYQSLHTVIIDSNGNRIEVQIRTHDMHEFAERGVAAHWSYKEGGKHDAAIEKNINALRQYLQERGNEGIHSEDFRNELFNDRVYVLTPAGKLMDLVKGATPLDFAYAIHSEVGHRCRGAKVNGRIVPLTYSLQSGEQVEILTSKEGGPNHNWLDSNLGYLKTSNAIGKVKSWFKNQQQSQNIAAGKSILDKEIQRLGIKTPNLTELAQYFKQATIDKLLEAIGRSDINARQLAGFFKLHELDAEPRTNTASPKKIPNKSGISVDGLDNILTSLASCCTPVQGDEIIGYISPRKGVTVHHKNCDNIRLLSPHKQHRLVNVSWGLQKTNYAVPIVVHAFNAQNILSQVSHTLSQAKIHIANAALDTHADFSATLNLTIIVENTDQLQQVLSKLSCLPNVLDAKRNV
ncbi:GTP diphosphokinase [Methylosoma difficile]